MDNSNILEKWKVKCNDQPYPSMDTSTNVKHVG
jgi:hypothetical protein